MMSSLHESFLQLVRIGIGASINAIISKDIDWVKLKALAVEQGLSSVVLDGIENLANNQRPFQALLLEWIGEMIHEEAHFKTQLNEAAKMADLFHQNYIRTYVLKGFVVAECYPKPNHRVSADMDCFLLPDSGNFNAWALGNNLVESKGIKIDYSFYKNSKYSFSELTVENHRFLTPFRGNKRLAEFEKVLQALMMQNNEDVFEGTHLSRPPVLVTALFLIEHSYSHFLHEGLTWRHVLDWLMFSRKHQKEIIWSDFEGLVEEYGFKKYYDSFSRLGKYLLGEIAETDLNKADQRMLADVWAPLDLHDTVKGLKGKLALVGNTWRARWKYHYFADISMLYALWIQVKGFLFIKEPKLSN